MKGIWLVFLFIFIAKLSLAQAPRAVIDSLVEIQTEKMSDSSRMEHSMVLAHAYLWTDNDSALYFSNRTIQLAKKLNNESYEVWGGIWKFTAEGLKRQDTQAIKTYFHTRELGQNIPDDILKTYLIIYAGILYLQESDPLFKMIDFL